MTKIISVISDHRASDGAIAAIVEELKKEFYVWKQNDTHWGDYALAVGDRTETFDLALDAFRKGVPIIHLWAGEKSCWTTEDDVYRTAISLMSDVQLCVNKTAKDTNDIILMKCGKKPNSHIVGNPYLDDMTTDDRIVPDEPYDLVLWNPIRGHYHKDKAFIENTVIPNHIWIEGNHDISTYCYWNTPSRPRPIYLGLLKNCQRFITNSSSAYTEAVFFNKEIVWVGDRNRERESKYADMMITGCREKVLEIFKGLE